METYCVIGKSSLNELPHLISSSIGIESKELAKKYEKQFSKMKNQFGWNKKQYEWVKYKKLNEVVSDNEIMIMERDKYVIELYTNLN